MIILVLAHFAAAALIAVAATRHVRLAVAIAAAAPLATLGWLLLEAPGVLDGVAVTQRISWIADIGLSIDLRLDGAALLLALLVSAIGLGIVVYSWGYFGANPSAPRFLAALVGFAGSMLGLAVSDHLIALYLFWELTTVTSYLLIGHSDRSEPARAAAQQAALVTVFGGLTMLGGIILLGLESGTYLLSELVAAPPGGTTVAVALGLIAVGALTKSAQFPFHDWLPGAMAAPTPASAYLHSATMVKAGVFLLLRLAPVAVAVGYWTPLIGALGAITMFLGGWRALREHDLKLILAYGTLSQLGLLTVVAAGAGPAAVMAGLAMVLAHALFKATLFLVAGSVDRMAGTRDIRALGGLRHHAPVLAGVAVAAGASMAGVPPLFGFVAKEAVLDALLTEAPLLAWTIAAASVLTVAYTARVLRVFFGVRPEGLELRSAPRTGIAIPAVLALAGVVAGLFPGLAKVLVAPAGESVTGIADAAKLVLWPGFKLALAMSAGSLTLGLGLVAFADRVDGLIERLPRAPSARRAYEATVAGLLRVASRSTAVFQSGSLPVYLGVVVMTVVIVPGAALLGAWRLPESAIAVDGWLQGAVIGLMVVSATALVLARRRFAALLLLGAVGYGMAGLFVIQGAPDLALTQLLIETVGLVVLAVVLYRMPVRFDRPPWKPGRIIRGFISLAIGAFVTGALLVAGSEDPLRSDAAFQFERAKTDGGGANVVNVILTDFRALDTFGEITVLTTAAVGIGGLLLGLRSRREDS